MFLTNIFFCERDYFKALKCELINDNVASYYTLSKMFLVHFLVYFINFNHLNQYFENSIVE